MGIVEYIKENKILILLLIIITLVAYFYLWPQSKIEKMDSTIASIDNLVGKDISLRYNKNGDVYYIGVVNKNQCNTLKGAPDQSCSAQTAILQKERTPNTTFKIIKRFNKDDYFLISLDNAKLGHHLNIPKTKTIGPDNYLCFSLGQAPTDTAFNIVPHNSGYMLVFTKQELQTNGTTVNTNYYVGECGVTGICKFKTDVYLKLCLTTDINLAIAFDFVSMDQTVVQPTSEHPNQEIHQEMMHNVMGEHHSIESFDNVSNFSLYSQDTFGQCNTMSLPGPGGLSEYASWDSESL
jgi:hypothetical protein